MYIVYVGLWTYVVSKYVITFADFCVDLSKRVSMMRDGFRFFWLLTSAAAVAVCVRSDKHLLG